MVDSRAGRKIKDEPEAPDKERKCLKKKKKNVLREHKHQKDTRAKTGTI